jgi:transposase, IS5 family
MRLDRSPAADVFARVPELATQTDPVLVPLEGLLDDDALFQDVWGDLVRRSRLTAGPGRHSTPAAVMLRLLVVTHRYAWSSPEPAERVADRLGLRWCCRGSVRRVPDATTLLRWAQTIQPETLHPLNDRTAQVAVQARVTRARTLRVDGSVVETTIPHPTARGWLGDGVRVLTRLLTRAQPLVGARLRGPREVLRARSHPRRRTLRALHRLVRRTGEAVEAEQRQRSQQLIQTTEQVIGPARQVEPHLATRVRRLRPGAGERGRSERLRPAVNHFLPLGEQVVRPARVRGVAGGKVPAQENIVRLCEPHPRLLHRRQTGVPTLIWPPPRPGRGGKAGSSRAIASCPLVPGNTANA